MEEHLRHHLVAMATQAGPGAALEVSPFLRCGFSLDLGKRWYKWYLVLLESSVLTALALRLFVASGLTPFIFFYLLFPIVFSWHLLFMGPGCF